MERIRKAEWGVAIALTGVVLFLLVIRTLHAGGLWRDECGALQVARMASYSEFRKYCSFESFPPLFPATVRAYTDLVGTSNGALRGFGFLVGASLVAVLWFNARQLCGKPPLVALALLGFNGTFLTYGTSIRGYGIGSVCILLAFGLIEKARRVTTPPWIAAACCASLASVHYLLFNIVLLSAIGFSVLAVSLMRRERRPALAVLGIGVVCAASMAPVVGMFSGRNQWNMLLQSDVGIASLGSELLSTLGNNSPLFIGLWVVLFVAIAIGAARFFRRSQKETIDSQRSEFYLALLVAIFSLIGYGVFMTFLSFAPRVWYFLALVCIVAASIELMADSLSQVVWFCWLRVLLVLAATVALPLSLWPAVTKRQTNMDLVAEKLEQSATPDDLILVTPWYHGVSFDWYYHGKAAWVTLPALADHRIHRYDLMKEKIMEPHPIDDVLESAGKTLKSGNRVWIVGGVYFLPPGKAPLVLPPAPNSPYGWAEPAYSLAWSQQAGAFLQRRATHAEIVKVSTGISVNELESAPLWELDGWRE
jgi:hypothetical protein